MAALARVTVVEHLGGRTLRVGFSDGLVRELDFAGKLPGVLATIDDDDVFAGATVDQVAGTVCWAAGIDPDPDVLHGDAAAAPALQPRVVREYRLQQAG
jgi:hypothetical protein